MSKTKVELLEQIVQLEDKVTELVQQLERTASALNARNSDLDFYKRRLGYLTTSTIEQFRQIVDRPIWDGNLVSKPARNALVSADYVDQANGFNFLSAAGVKLAAELGFLQMDQRPLTSSVDAERRD